MRAPSQSMTEMRLDHETKGSHGCNRRSCQACGWRGRGCREERSFLLPAGSKQSCRCTVQPTCQPWSRLIRDFQMIAPNVTIEYSEYVTNDLFNLASTECNAKQGTMDLVLSSSVDQLVKLVNDGCGDELPVSHDPSAAVLDAMA